MAEDNGSKDDGSDRRTDQTARSDPPQQSNSDNPGQPSGETPGDGTDKRTSGIQVGEIVALRCWRVRKGNRLYSIYFDTHEWLPETALVANKVTNPDTPDPEVGLLGIHAFKEQDALDDYLSWIYPYALFDNYEWSERDPTEGLVWGEVELFGTVWEHSLGYRAQYARIKTFRGTYGSVDLEALQKRYARVEP